MRALTAKTAVHEIGHQLNIGKLDDDGDEVYSGSSGDSSHEYTVNPLTNRAIDDWSVMSNGLQSDQFVQPTDDTYTAFSLEELTTLELP